MKLLVVLSLLVSNVFAADKLVNVVMSTSQGDIHLELNETKAPITVKNFLSYADKKFYNGLIFHRVIKQFMIQGGGFNKQMTQVKPGAPIKNEAKNGLKNDKGTIAMARTNVVDSATSQFFINSKNNDFLNHSSDSNYGYAVFGRVTKGMSILKKIETMKTATTNGHQNVPVEAIIIKSVKKI
jgi:cyclophilin family peptidyl-prolyl cis-trans isomerase